MSDNDDQNPRIAQWLGLSRDAEQEMAFYTAIAMRMAVLTAAVLLPFAIYHVLYGHIAIALAAGAVVVIKTAVMLYLRRGGSGVTGVHVVALTYTVASVMTVYLLGTSGYLWMYVTMVGSFYSLPGRSSLVLNGAAFAAIMPVAVADGELGLRFAITLAMVFLFGYILADQVRIRTEELSRVARLDPLTGAGNRRSMDEELDRAAAQHDRDGRPAALIVLDLDHFKRINDRFGHRLGDQVLARVADALRERLRATDRLFRFGGEEFVVLAPGAMAAGVLTLAEDLRQRISDLDLAGLPSLSASFGIAERQQGEDTDAWLARADAALYEAKGAGRNRVLVASQRPVVRGFAPTPSLI